MAKTIEEMAHAYTFNEHLSPLNEVLHQADLNAEIQYQKDIEKSYVAGANAVLKEMEKEIRRSFLEDYNDFTDGDREIAQGVLGTLNIWIKQLRGE